MQPLQITNTENDSIDQQFYGLKMKSYAQNSVGRQQVEQTILKAYQKNFGAQLSHFMPRLISAALPGQAAHLNFGLCGASEQPLYLESYLSEPIEDILSRAVRSRVGRESIAEIGNLAFSHTENLQQDLAAIASYCQQQGYRYVVCTATRTLRLLFLRAGMKPVHLANAQQSDAPRDGSHWGDYYETTPQIIGGNVLLAQQHLQHA